MLPMEFYIDESYNSHVFCIGGFLATTSLWQTTSDRWQARIAYENRKSKIKGFPSVSRYHATDCANLKREFDAKKGWNIKRQIALTRRLCEIIGESGLIGIAVGGRIADAQAHFDPTVNTGLETLYDLCYRMILLIADSVVRENFSTATVNVTYDQTKAFCGLAKEGFETLLKEQRQRGLHGPFKALVDADSRACTPLQCADFLAYEALKRLDGIRRGNEMIRKSLQAVMGDRITLRIEQFTSQNFIDMHRMVENKINGRPVGEGVSSKLLISVSS
jgi:hypothetical protein